MDLLIFFLGVQMIRKLPLRSFSMDIGKTLLCKYSNGSEAMISQA
jgi:hypothetical protein